MIKPFLAKLKPQLDTSELSLLRHTLSGAKEFVLSEKSEVSSALNDLFF